MKRISCYKKNFNINDKDYNYFWNILQNKKWEQSTFEFFDKHLDDRTVYFDIGAWIGPTILYSAQNCKKAIGYEPDPVAFKNLKDNLDSNNAADWFNRVRIKNEAISSVPGKISLGSWKKMGDSMSSTLWIDRKNSWEVNSITLQQEVKKYVSSKDKIFLKIDIEGGEFDLIPKIADVLKKRNVTAIISLHPMFLKSSISNNLKNLNFLKKFFKKRETFYFLYKQMLDSLPSNKKINIGGKNVKNKRWHYLYMFLFCTPFGDNKIIEI